MPDILKLEWDPRELEAAFDDLSVAAQKATVNTTNVVGRAGNRAINKHIKATYNIKGGDLKIGRLVRVIRADARKSRPVFTISIKYKRRPLMMYDATQTPTGVSVLVKKSRKTIRSAFISSWKKKGTRLLTFKRDPGLGKYKKGRSLRTKRQSLRGPSISGLYGSRRSRQIFAVTVEKLYQPELDRQFNMYFEKKR